MYDGSLEYEKKYLSTYIKTDKSFLAIVLDNDLVVGVTTAIHLSEETEEFKIPFSEFNIDKIVYFGESIIKNEYRGKKIGHEFFRLREDFANKLIPNLEYTCFCAVNRESNHHLMPLRYRPLDGFWNRMGYRKQSDLFTEYKWKDIDKDLEDKKKMTFWIKKWK